MSNIEIKQRTIFDFIKKSNSIIIPFYQREYTWTDKECLQLLNDVNEFNHEAYYLGAIITKHKGHSLIIIDGQQRISTVILILKALLRTNKLAEEQKQHLGSNLDEIDFDSKNLVDSNILISILNDDENIDSKCNYWKNYKEIMNWLKNKTSLEINQFYLKIKNLTIADIVVKEAVDEFSLFSQINSTGKQLSCLELVKNLLFQKITEYYQLKNNDYKYEKELSKFAMITSFIKDEKQKAKFLRHFIALKTKKLPNNDDKEIFNKFNQLYKDNNDYRNNPTILLDELVKFFVLYKWVLNDEYLKDRKIDELPFTSLKENFDTYIVLIYRIIEQCGDFNENKVIIKNYETLNNLLLILEAYKYHRFFCDLKDKIITRFIPAIEFDNNSSIPLDMQLYCNLFYKPNNEGTKNGGGTINQFRSGILNKKAYLDSKAICKSFLIRLSKYKYKERYNYNNFTIEHILPQNDSRWNIEPEKRTAVDEMKHTIGNLTLTVYNAELSNSPFNDKKVFLMNKDNFPLNKYFNSIDHWDVATIETRALDIFNTTQAIWNLSLYETKMKTYYPEINVIEETDIDKTNNNIRNLENKTLKNVIHFSKQYELTYEKIVGVIEDYIVTGISYEKIEKKYFNPNRPLKGWYAQGILHFFDLKSDNKKKFSLNDCCEFIKQHRCQINELLDIVNNNKNT